MKIEAHVSKVEKEGSSLRARADITVENCVKLIGIMVKENREGELWVQYPQKDVRKDGKVELKEDGYPKQTDVFYANNVDINHAIKDLVLKAYDNMMEKGEEYGYADIYPEKGEHVNSTIEPKLHACSTEVTKASGRILIGGYMVVPDIFVRLHYTQDESAKPFLTVSYPHFKTGDRFVNFVQPLTNGKIWDGKEKVEKEHNFKKEFEDMLKEETMEFHPELKELFAASKEKEAKDKVQDLIDKAKANVEKDEKKAPERELEPSM